MKMWSGPGRALSEHLARFEKAQRLHDRPESAPGEIGFWRSFARSYATFSRLVEGSSSAALEDMRIREEDARLNWLAKELAESEYEILNGGDTLYVAHNIIELVTMAAEMAEPEPIFPTDLPTKTGVVILEQPLLMSDLDPKTGQYDEQIKLPVRAIGWDVRPVRRSDDSVCEGVYLVAWTDGDAYKEIYLPSLEHLGHSNDGNTVYAPPGLQPIEVNPWAFGTVWGSTTDATEMDNTVIIESVAYLRRWILSLCRLMWQEILSPDHYTPDRAHRRRCDRIGWHREQGDVKVVKMRRVYQEHEREDGEGGWTLDHRVVVRGHWRRQYYRSLGEVGDDAAYRMVWIAPHIRGPESAPLVLKHNVTAVVR
jgi:hypothetical protein